MKTGKLIVLTGPSGVGKGTLVKQLQDKHTQLKVSISATTRQPRPGEIDGKDYLFWSRDVFTRAIAEGKLLEWAEYAGNYYGTPLQSVQASLEQGETILLEIEVVGAKTVKKLFPQAFLIFILPPSLSELEVRLRGRGPLAESMLQERLDRAREELAQAPSFDLQIVNDDLQQALKVLEQGIFGWES
ncbi:MAG: guanylate kinase [Cyanobacteria bacterium P01_H01_bin.15]